MNVADGSGGARQANPPQGGVIWGERATEKGVVLYSRGPVLHCCILSAFYDELSEHSTNLFHLSGKP